MGGAETLHTSVLKEGKERERELMCFSRSRKVAGGEGKCSRLANRGKYVL